MVLIRHLLMPSLPGEAIFLLLAIPASIINMDEVVKIAPVFLEKVVALGYNVLDEKQNEFHGAINGKKSDEFGLGAKGSRTPFFDFRGADLHRMSAQTEEGVAVRGPSGRR
ncbi:MAG TPA: hypothetical protein PK876_03695 [Elusimicrobiota bacterium]|nr:hypothetical protein [Elusimicrobiota bacterium]